MFIGWIACDRDFANLLFQDLTARTFLPAAEFLRRFDVGAVWRAKLRPQNCPRLSGKEPFVTKLSGTNSLSKSRRTSTQSPCKISLRIGRMTSDMKLLPICRDCNSHFQLFELARLLVRLDRIARFIDNANHSIMSTAEKPVCDVRTRLFVSLSPFSPFSASSVGSAPFPLLPGVILAPVFGRAYSWPATLSYLTHRIKTTGRAA